MTINGTTYGKTSSGDRVDIVTVENSSGISFSAISFGATLISVKTPGRSGKSEEITLGKKDLAAYEAGHPYFGSTVGRVGNRIAEARFSIDGNVYNLAANNGPNCLHGGVKAFDKRIWDIFPFRNEKAAGVRFTYVSPDGEEGFPGTMEISAVYTLTEDSELTIEYEAICDKACPINLTNHTYWNLTDIDGGDVLDHELSLNCSKYLPVNDVQIPTGELAAVSGTPFDFTEPKKIGADIEKAGGFDHNWVTEKYSEGSDALGTTSDKLKTTGEKPFAVLTEAVSGRRMEFFTTQPGVQFYSGNFLENENGRTASYGKHAGLCLETQNFPNAINQPGFPDSVLRPGITYAHQTIIRFSTI